jgi:hypothetical protein
MNLLSQIKGEIIDRVGKFLVPTNDPSIITPSKVTLYKLFFYVFYAMKVASTNKCTNLCPFLRANCVFKSYFTTSGFFF